MSNGKRPRTQDIEAEGGKTRKYRFTPSIAPNSPTIWYSRQKIRFDDVIVLIYGFGSLRYITGGSGSGISGIGVGIGIRRRVLARVA